MGFATRRTRLMAFSMEKRTDVCPEAALGPKEDGWLGTRVREWWRERTEYHEEVGELGACD